MGQRKYIKDYNEDTGMPHSHIEYFCPNYRWYRTHHDRHDICGEFAECIQRQLRRMLNYF